jgi:hypothetical protein
MTRITPSVGNTAQNYSTNWSPSYSQKLIWRLKKFAGRVAEVTFGCHHRNLTLPYNDHQTCLDCGATRLYIFNPEPRLAGISTAKIFIGRWKKSSPDACQQVSKAIISEAISTAPCKPPARKRCRDCGEELDAFGVCPQVDPRDILRSNSPIFCDKAARA